jgi:hypothetical protein
VQVFAATSVRKRHILKTSSKEEVFCCIYKGLSCTFIVDKTFGVKYRKQRIE